MCYVPNFCCLLSAKIMWFIVWTNGTAKTPNEFSVCGSPTKARMGLPPTSTFLSFLCGNGSLGNNCTNCGMLHEMAWLCSSIQQATLSQPVGYVGYCKICGAFTTNVFVCICGVFRSLQIKNGYRNITPSNGLQKIFLLQCSFSCCVFRKSQLFFAQKHNRHVLEAGTGKIFEQRNWKHLQYKTKGVVAKEFKIWIFGHWIFCIRAKFGCQCCTFTCNVFIFF